jgi:hypothetical protein
MSLTVPPRGSGREREDRDRFREIYEANYARILGYALRRGACRMTPPMSWQKPF